MFTFSLIVLVIVGLIILLALGGIGAVPKPDKKILCLLQSQNWFG